ncbi:hypothetical protein RND81_14G109800 [Saponaria officinalis]|uniref:Reverse transcriptase n=1 Tax=Saponaria officinalis TaxID=3572 RepID=A0AAW1GSM7_SAPOF
MLRKAAHEGKIHGARVCRGAPRISHLFFADDSILFARANHRECSIIADITSKYEGASGQKINYSKSEITFSKKVTGSTREEIREILNVREVDKHNKYLGLPTIIGRSKKIIFDSIKERMWKKVQGWKEKTLSKSGIEVLIKSVVQALPTYMMSLFLFPEETINDLHSLLARFWWGLNVWRLMNNPKSLAYETLKAKYFKAKYFKNGSILDSRLGYDPSYTWRSLWSSKALLLEGLKWRVGNGRMCELIDADRREWDVTALQQTFYEEDVNDILGIPISNRLPEDIQTWCFDKRGMYTVRSGYWLGMSGHINEGSISENNNSLAWNLCWKLDVPPKLSHFVWRACANILPVKANLHQRHIVSDPLCSVCGSDVETPCHAMFLCQHGHGIWMSISWRDLSRDAPKSSFICWLEWMPQRVDNDELCNILSLTWAAWTTRNMTLFDEDPPKVAHIMMGFSRLVADYRLYAKMVFDPYGYHLSTSPSTWIPPQLGIIKINSDAAVFENGEVGWGAVVRDSDGHVLSLACKRFRGRCSPEIAEGGAAKFGILLAKRMGVHRVSFESDALGLVEAVRKGRLDRNSLGLLVEDICVILHSFDSFNSTHVKRGGNTIAHYAARFITDVGVESTFVSDFPPVFLNLAELDMK